MADNTLLLIHGDAISDASSNGLVITNNGVSISTSVTKFGKGSLYFKGSAYLTMPGGSFSFGTGDFTVECWVRPESISTDSFFFSGGTNSAFFFGRQANTKIGIGRSAVAWDTEISRSLTVGAWSHVAVCRKSGTVYFFVNGTLIGSAANTQNYTMQGGLAYVGAQGNNYYYKGYIEELRVSNIARWTSNFTPPTEQYNVVAGSRTLIDAVGYQSTTGNGMVNAAAYMVTQGKAMVDGVIYTISLKEKEVIPTKATISITGNGSDQSYIVANGGKYNSASVIEVDIGSVIDCYVRSCASLISTGVYVNGVIVAQGPADWDVHKLYSYKVTMDASFRLYSLDDPYGYGRLYGKIEITE